MLSANTPRRGFSRTRRSQQVCSRWCACSCPQPLSDSRCVGQLSTGLQTGFASTVRLLSLPQPRQISVTNAAPSETACRCFQHEGSLGCPITSGFAPAGVRFFLSLFLPANLRFKIRSKLAAFHYVSAVSAAKVGWFLQSFHSLCSHFTPLLQAGSRIGTFQSIGEAHGLAVPLWKYLLCVSGCVSAVPNNSR
jgi:hypothetical protein